MSGKQNYNYQSLRKHMEGMKYDTWQEQEAFVMHVMDYYSSHIPMEGDEDDKVFLAEYDMHIEDFTEDPD